MKLLILAGLICFNVVLEQVNCITSKYVPDKEYAELEKIMEMKKKVYFQVRELFDNEILAMTPDRKKIDPLRTRLIEARTEYVQAKDKYFERREYLEDKGILKPSKRAKDYVVDDME